MQYTACHGKSIILWNILYKVIWLRKQPFKYLCKVLSKLMHNIENVIPAKTKSVYLPPYLKCSSLKSVSIWVSKIPYQLDPNIYAFWRFYGFNHSCHLYIIYFCFVIIYMFCFLCPPGRHLSTDSSSNPPLKRECRRCWRQQRKGNKINCTFDIFVHKILKVTVEWNT